MLLSEWITGGAIDCKKTNAYMFAFIIKTEHSIIVHILQSKRQLERDVGKFEPNGAATTWRVQVNKVVIVEVRASYLQSEFVNPTMTGYNLYI